MKAAAWSPSAYRATTDDGSGADSEHRIGLGREHEVAPGQAITPAAEELALINFQLLAWPDPDAAPFGASRRRES